ncbi:MAG TPA: polysaccharide deacetylase family protein [Kofleriaceae bacterium]
MTRGLVLAWLALAACRHSDPDYLGYDWDDRRVLCAADLDDITAPVDERFIHEQIEAARDGGWALVLYAHTPTATVSLGFLDEVMTWADQAGLRYYTFRELVPDDQHRPHPGLVLAFDDAAPDYWLEAEPLFEKHGAHVTFFVSQWQDIPEAGHAEIKALFDKGHDIEPHSKSHKNAVDYVAAHGVDAYVHDEVLPSLQALTDAGYPKPAAFAYPFGAHTDELDTAILNYVDKVRATRGQCPWRKSKHRL